MRGFTEFTMATPHAAKCYIDLSTVCAVTELNEGSCSIATDNGHGYNVTTSASDVLAMLKPGGGKPESEGKTAAKSK